MRITARCHHPSRVVVALVPFPLSPVRRPPLTHVPSVRLRMRTIFGSAGGKQVLEEYVKLFDMRDKTFVEALRAFLKEFRLPGEVGYCSRHSHHLVSVVGAVAWPIIGLRWEAARYTSWDTLVPFFPLPRGIHW